MGGSYPGALTAWTAKLAPGTFWAYHASSAVVQALYDFWGYFLPIENGMPRNCSLDIMAVVEHVDGVLAAGNDTEVQALKQSFGLGELYDDDFAL